MLEATPAADVTIEGFTAIPLDEHAILVTFRTTSRGPDVAARHAQRSSIWVRRDGRWRLRFHQATPAPRGGSAKA